MQTYTFTPCVCVSNNMQACLLETWYQIMKNEMLKLLLDEKKEELEIQEFGIIKTTELVFKQEVRDICEKGGCGKYGTCWSCPPGVGTLEKCEEEILKYDYALIFTTFQTLKDSFDVEGMTESNMIHDRISRKIRSFVKKILSNFLMLSSEGCPSCEKCTYPNSTCRFPKIMSPAVESYGIIVIEEAKAANIKYINGVNTVTHFGNIFFSQ